MMWAMHYRFSRHGGVVIVRPLSRQPSSGTLGRFKVAHEAAQTSLEAENDLICALRISALHIRTYGRRSTDSEISPQPA